MLASILIHAGILIFAIFGLPHLMPEPPVIAEPIPVEIMTVAEKTQVTKPPSSPEKKLIPKKAEPKEPKKPVEPTKTEKAPAKPTPPKPAPKPPEPKPPEPVKPEVSDIAPPKKELPKPKETPKPAPPQPTPVKTAEKPDESKDADQSEEMDNLLKNLMKDEPPPAREFSPQSNGELVPNAAVGDKMTMSETAALVHQLSECWKLMAGARYGSDLVVKLKLTVNPDRTLQNAEIVDMGRYNSDGFFRAAADSAVRAVYNPRCSPLELPPDKYNQWKTTIINFDPSQML